MWLNIVVGDQIVSTFRFNLPVIELEAKKLSTDIFSLAYTTLC